MLIVLPPFGRSVGNDDHGFLINDFVKALRLEENLLDSLFEADVLHIHGDPFRLEGLVEEEFHPTLPLQESKESLHLHISQLDVKGRGI